MTTRPAISVHFECYVSINLFPFVRLASFVGEIICIRPFNNISRICNMQNSDYGILPQVKATKATAKSEPATSKGKGKGRGKGKK